MRLATLNNGTRDGQLVVVSSDHTKCVAVGHIAPHLQAALDDWANKSPQLEEVSKFLNEGKTKDVMEFDESKVLSPLPRAYQFLDGSAYIQHIILVRKARNAEPPETLTTVPLMYQGLSHGLLAPYQDIPFQDESFGLDLEGEVAVITDDVPMGTKASDAHKHIKLFVLMNDVSLRGLIPAELKQGFGFMQSKPASALSPLAITPDELGENLKEGKVYLPLKSEINGKFFGDPEAGVMHFSFGQLIEHACKTRDLIAGTIVGSGTVSNEDEARGQSCLAETRMLEKINQGDFKTSFLSPGDTVKIWMEDKNGKNLFGNIFQKVVKK